MEGSRSSQSAHLECARTGTPLMRKAPGATTLLGKVHRHDVDRYLDVALPAIVIMLEDSEPIVREAAVWAFSHTLRYPAIFSEHASVFAKRMREFPLGKSGDVVAAARHAMHMLDKEQGQALVKHEAWEKVAEDDRRVMLDVLELPEDPAEWRGVLRAPWE